VAADYIGLAGSLLIPSECYDNADALRQLCEEPKSAGVERWVPILVIHGERDKVIAPYHGTTLLKEARQLGHPMAEAAFSKTATHNRWAMREDLVKPMLAFFSKYIDGWSEGEDSWTSSILGTISTVRCGMPMF